MSGPKKNAVLPLVMPADDENERLDRLDAAAAEREPMVRRDDGGDGDAPAADTNGNSNDINKDSDLQTDGGVSPKSTSSRLRGYMGNVGSAAKKVGGGVNNAARTLGGGVGAAARGVGAGAGVVTRAIGGGMKRTKQMLGGLRRRPHGLKPMEAMQDVYFGVEGTSFHRPDGRAADVVAREQTSGSLLRARILPAVVVICLGFLVSFVTNLILYVTSVLESWKVGMVADELEAPSSNWTNAWLIWTGFGLVCTLLACFCVLVAPAARASGIPGVLALLNGAVAPPTPNIFGKLYGGMTLQTLVCKVMSAILSVASGLFVGPEGPLIHIGAIIGHRVVGFVKYFTGGRVNKLIKGVSAGLLNAQTESWFHFSNSQQRDFVAIGAGCAISAAFSAPLAGVLFVAEEAASKVTVRLLEWAFLGCACAFMFTWSLKQSAQGDGHVKFDKPTISFCNLYTAADIFVFLCTAVLGGLIGAVFNQMVFVINRWRQRVINPSPVLRVVEVVIVTLVTCSAAVLMSYAWTCTESKPQLFMEGSVGCLDEEHWVQLSRGLAAEKDAYAFYVDPNGPFSLTDQETTWLANNLPQNGTDIVYMARPMSEVPHVTIRNIHHGQCGATGFNEMATLYLKGGVKGVKLLLTRGAPHIFSPGALLAFFFVYTLIAAYTSGISLASGLFIPHLLIGGAMGRLVGLLDLWVITQTCVSKHGIDPGSVSVIDWLLSGYRDSLSSCVAPDPGTYAMIGAAAVMGGSGRITVFLAVIMLELTSDLQFMPVIAITVIVAMWVGNLFNHGLYHSLVGLMGVPFLDADPHPAMLCVPVKTIMSRDVVVCHEHMDPAEVKRCLAQASALVKQLLAEQERRQQQQQQEQAQQLGAGGDEAPPPPPPAHSVPFHHGFPVVDGERCLVGLVEREDLERLLAEAERNGGQVVGAQAGDALEADESKLIRVEHVMHRAPYTVYEEASVSRAYDLFRDMGLRHLTVINRKGQVTGIVTRKDLMTWRLEESVAEAEGAAAAGAGGGGGGEGARKSVHVHDHHGWRPANAAHHDH